jgi:fused signal recognition particle receptor
MFVRLQSGLARTRATLANLFSGQPMLDADLFEEIENVLLSADIGIEVTQHILSRLKNYPKTARDQQDLRAILQQEMLQILAPANSPLVVHPHSKPFSILVVGVNGVGKTTTIGKLAHYFQVQHYSVMLAAGDTFRAAAVEQLQIWGERNAIPVIAQAHGADSAAVIFDALQAARARNTDILIADTAGRLHTKTNLMEELKKIKRSMARLEPTAPHEVLLVLDAGTGQNALQQAQQFHAAVGVTGIVLTKLDGTAKGGIILAIAQTLKLPIRFIGVGELIDDLRPFNAEEFVSALLSEAAA